MQQTYQNYFDFSFVERHQPVNLKTLLMKNCFDLRYIN